MQIGSEAHKELFCRTFFEGHREYDQKTLPWPDLSGEQLALLRGIPFWTQALQAEADAGPLIRACAQRESDPLIRDALDLQAAEETRHLGIISHMLELYGLEAGEVHVDLPPDVVEGFIDFGYEECLDSFGAFGLFALAREHALVPEPLFDIFDQVMQEEAHHIVFFLNWFAHRQANAGLLPRLMRPTKGLLHYGRAIRNVAGLIFDDDEGDGFTVTGAQAFLDDLTPRLVMERCLSENERRLAGFDRRLLVPELFPRLTRLGVLPLKLWPGSSRGPSVKRAETRPES
jgi:hypothetical protein